LTKIIYGTIYIFIVYLIFGLYISSQDIKVIEPTLNSKNSSDFYDYKGAINVHSELSTGTGTSPEIFEAAEKSKLDFLITTDLNTFPLPLSNNNYHNKVLVMTNSEFSYLDTKLLYIKSKSNESIDNLGQASAVLSEHLSDPNVKSDSIVIWAHPTKKGSKWTGKIPAGLDGLEIINLKSLWQDSWLNKKITFIWSFLIYPFNPELAFLRLFQRAEKEILLWEELNNERLRIAFAGTDAESRFNFLKTPLKFPAYENLFKIVSNHILIRSELTGDYDKDQPKVFNAIKSGQFYLSLDMIGDPKGFLFYLQTPRDKVFMGSTVKYISNSKLIIDLPDNIKVPIKIKIYRNNSEQTSLTDKKNIYDITKPGIYRAVVFTKISLPFPEGRKWFPWIFTNSIKVD